MDSRRHHHYRFRTRHLGCDLEQLGSVLGVGRSRGRWWRCRQGLGHDGTGKEAS